MCVCVCDIYMYIYLFIYSENDGIIEQDGQSSIGYKFNGCR